MIARSGSVITDVIRLRAKNKIERNTDMGHEDSAMVTGFVHSITVGKRGIEINIVSPEIEAAAAKDLSLIHI